MGRPPTLVGQLEHGCGGEPERGAQLLQQIGERIVRTDKCRRRPRQRCCLGASRRRLARPSRGAVDEEADDDGHKYEHAEGDDVLSIAHGDGVQRWGQEPVGQAERGDRGDEACAQPAERGDRHDEAQIEHQCRSHRDVPADGGQDRGQ